MADQGNVVPFGKYKGRLIEELLINDPSYLQWLAGQDWFRAKYITLHQVIINRGAEPEETPEHNALQALFLDDEFCMRLRLVDPGIDRHQFLERRRKKYLERAEDEIRNEEENMAGWVKGNTWNKHHTTPPDLSELWDERAQYLLPVEIAFRIRCTFEEYGVDVTLIITPFSKPHPYRKYEHDVSSGDAIEKVMTFTATIEIKPVVSDDYPAVLRQMRRNGSHFLFLERYTGTGATREQFIKTFASAGITVVFKDQVQ
jgi:uncharacterized protein (DUF3820 family)